MSNNTTEIIFILDRSGSMGGIESDTIGGYNGFLKNQAELDGKALVTTVLFDDKYEVLHSQKDANEIVLTAKEYFVRGSTALLDSVAKAILEASSRITMMDEADKPRNVIVVITTDGEENASKEFTYSKVSNLIKNQQEKYGWDFIYMGANINVEKEAGKIGLAPKFTGSFSSTAIGMTNMYTDVNTRISDIRSRKSSK